MHHKNMELLIKANTKMGKWEIWTEREYYVQEDTDVLNKDVQIFLNTTHFPSLPFCGPQTKPHGVRELSKHYHIIFDTTLGHGICTICQMPCACIECTSMLDKPSIPYLSPQQQPHYQPIKDFTYWPVLVSFNSWNIMTL